MLTESTELCLGAKDLGTLVFVGSVLLYVSIKGWMEDVLAHVGHFHGKQCNRDNSHNVHLMAFRCCALSRFSRARSLRFFW